MTFLTNAVFADLLSSQLNNVGYGLRGFMRINGESLGMPQAIPNHRKMDYWFRDFFMVFVSAYFTELAYRIGEQAYIIPNFIRLLELGKLKEQYAKDSIHRPSFVNSSMDIKNAGREFPSVLRKHMLGSLSNPRSFKDIPDVLEDVVIPKLKAKKTSQQEIQQIKLIAHHLRKKLHPDQYIDKFLVAAGKISAEDGKLLKENLKKLDSIAKLFENAGKPITAKELYAELKKTGRLDRIAKSLTEKDFEKAFNEPSIKDLITGTFKKGFQKSYKQYSRFKALANSHILRQYRQTPSSDTKELYKILTSWHADPLLKESSFLKQIKKVVRNEKELFQLLKSPLNMKKFSKSVAPNLNIAWSDELTKVLREQIFIPRLNDSFKEKSILKKLFHDLSSSKIIQKQVHRVSEGGRFWIKLPLSLLFLFLFYGLVANSFDAKYVQPYQRELAKKRGDTLEFIKPAFLGIIPGVAAFTLAMIAPPVKKLGYVASFLVAGLSGIVSYGLSTMAMFKASISKPRQVNNQSLSLSSGMSGSNIFKNQPYKTYRI